MSNFCLVLVCPPEIEEKLLDTLLVIVREMKYSPAHRPLAMAPPMATWPVWSRSWAVPVLYESKFW